MLNVSKPSSLKEKITFELEHIEHRIELIKKHKLLRIYSDIDLKTIFINVLKHLKIVPYDGYKNDHNKIIELFCMVWKDFENIIVIDENDEFWNNILANLEEYSLDIYWQYFLRLNREYEFKRELEKLEKKFKRLSLN